jgi:hypothetical protein
VAARPHKRLRAARKSCSAVRLLRLGGLDGGTLRDLISGVAPLVALIEVAVHSDRACWGDCRAATLMNRFGRTQIRFDPQ